MSFRGTWALFLYAQSSFRFRPRRCFHILVWVSLSTHHWPWNQRDWFYSLPCANVLSAVSHQLFGWRRMRRTDWVQIHTWIESHKTSCGRVYSPPSFCIWRSCNDGSVTCALLFLCDIWSLYFWSDFQKRINKFSANPDGCHAVHALHFRLNEVVRNIHYCHISFLLCFYDARQ